MKKTIKNNILKPGSDAPGGCLRRTPHQKLVPFFKPGSCAPAGCLRRTPHRKRVPFLKPGSRAPAGCLRRTPHRKRVPFLKLGPDGPRRPLTHLRDFRQGVGWKQNVNIWSHKGRIKEGSRTTRDLPRLMTPRGRRIQDGVGVSHDPNVVSRLVPLSSTCTAISQSL